MLQSPVYHKNLGASYFPFGILQRGEDFTIKAQREGIAQTEVSNIITCMKSVILLCNL